MQAAERVLNAGLGRQRMVPQGKPEAENRRATTPSLRWQYSAHPSLRPTVFVPGPVVAVRKV